MQRALPLALPVDADQKEHDDQNQKKQCGDDLCFHANSSRQRMRDLVPFL